MLGRPLGLLTTLTRLRLSIALNQGSERALGCGLRRLHRLADLTITFDDTVVVASIARNLSSLTALTSLQLWNSYMGSGSATAAVVARALRHLPRLADLSLAASNVGADGAAALAPPLGHFTALQHLNLSAN